MWFKKERIYADYASAPPVLPQAMHAAEEAERFFGNPGAIHLEGIEAKRSLEDSRERIARILECKAREIIFTSGLTEANNIAIVGRARALERVRRTLSGTHWIVSAIEHPSVLESFAEVERMGGTVTHLPCNARGVISAESLRAALSKETVFVSVGWGNNEVGVVQPLGKLASAIRTFERESGTAITFHSDAGQSPLYLSATIESLGVDLLSLGGNKLYGPHGVGALVRRHEIDLSPLSFGGKQERGLSAGTESVALAAGFAAAFEVIASERRSESARLEKLQREFVQEVEKIPGLVVNTDPKVSLPHIVNVSIPNVSSEYLTLALSEKGIAVSTKSACREGEESRSHVIAALEGGPPDGGWRATHTIRFSFGRETSESDARRVSQDLAALVNSIPAEAGIP